MVMYTYLSYIYLECNTGMYIPGGLFRVAFQKFDDAFKIFGSI